MKKIVIIAFFASFLCSCSKWIAPPYTNVERILQIQQGMTIQQTSQVLGIQPYDVKYLQEENILQVHYNYRLKEREMIVYDNIVDETSQISGTPQYNPVPAIIEVNFKDGKMISYRTVQQEVKDAGVYKRNIGKKVLIGLAGFSALFILIGILAH